MLDVFKARLKAKTKASGVNLSQKRIDAYADRLHKKFPTVTEEADHDKHIDDLNDVVLFADVAKEDDRIRTLEARNRQQDPQDEPDDQDEPVNNPAGKRKPSKKDDDVPAWAKTMMDELKTLKTEKVQSTIKTQLAEKLKGKNIPEKFYNKWTLPEKEEDLDQFATDVETQWTELKQEGNNLGITGSSAPVGGIGGGNKGGEEAAIDAWAQKSKPAEIKK
jgi:hypothetical protein